MIQNLSKIDGGKNVHIFYKCVCMEEPKFFYQEKDG